MKKYDKRLKELENQLNKLTKVYQKSEEKEFTPKKKVSSLGRIKKDEYDNRFVIVIATEKELKENIAAKNLMDKMSSLYLKIKKKHPRSNTALIAYDPVKGFHDNDLILLQNIRDKNKNTKIHICAHGRSGEDTLSSLGEDVKLNSDEQSSILKKILPQNLESQKITIDLIACRAAKVGDNLQLSLAQRLIHKLPLNIKLIARNEVVSVMEGFVETFIPKGSSEKEINETLNIYLHNHAAFYELANQLVKLEAELENEVNGKYASTLELSQTLMNMQILKNSFIESIKIFNASNYVWKAPGSKLIFSREEKNEVSIEYYVNNDKTLPALSGAIQFGHFQFLKHLLQNHKIRTQFESNIYQYLIDALNSNKESVAVELLSLKKNPLQSHTIVDLFITAILKNNHELCKILIDEKQCGSNELIQVKEKLNENKNLGETLQKSYSAFIDDLAVDKFISAYYNKTGIFFNFWSPMASRIRNRSTQPLKIEDIVDMGSSKESGKKTRTMQVCNEIGFTRRI